jgi:hypothetical protein
MRMKSIAFGTLELVGQVTEIKLNEGWLIVSLRTTTPAGWELRAAVTRADIWDLVKRMCKPVNILYLVFGFGKKKQNSRVPNY